MIYTMTLNPALDYVVDIDHIELGEVNRAASEHIFCGGKGLNVSVILKELGFESQCLGFVAGFTGEEIQRRATEDLHLQTEFIKLKEGLSRINVKIHSDQESEINGQGPVVTKDDCQKLFEQLKKIENGDVLILSGSVPSSMEKTIYRDIMQLLSDKDIKVVVDATGQLLEDTLSYRPFLIKPNHHELADIFDVTLNTLEDIEHYARLLQEKGAQNVLISMAGDGSLLIDEHGNSYHLGVCQGTVINSVGAGDSMVAGFVAGYFSGMNYLETLKLATASGGATAFSQGLATQIQINELLKQFQT